METKKNTNIKGFDLNGKPVATYANKSKLIGHPYIKYFIVNGAEKPNPNYDEKVSQKRVDRIKREVASNGRKSEYNGIQDQLDCLYKDIDTGSFGESAKSGKFYLHIKAIKDKYPVTN